MGLFASEGNSGVGGKYELAPEGVIQGVCADVWDLGVQPGFEGKPTHKVRLVFQVDQKNATTYKPLEASREFTLSGNEKANLRKFLEAWRGKSFELGEMGRLDLTTLVGKNALLTIEHVQSRKNADRKYGNIKAISPLLKGMAEIKVDGYTRREQKPEGGVLDRKPGEPF